MCPFLLLFIFLCAGLYFFAPLFKPRRAALPVLYVPQFGTAALHGRHAKNRTSPRSLRRLFAALAAQGFTAVLPQDILSGRPLPQKPVLIFFSGGYKSVYEAALPLLQQYKLKAVVGLPVGFIGQYNAWQPPHAGPWQDLLTPAQIQEMKQSGLFAFASETLDYAPLNGQDEAQALWQLQESKHRLLMLYKIKAQAVHFPQSDPQSAALLHAAALEYPLLIGNQTGNNRLPLRQGPLKIYPVRRHTCARRLLWKLTRP